MVQEHLNPDDRDPQDVETPRRYWVGVVIVVLAILLMIGFALVTFVASDAPTSSVDPTARAAESGTPDRPSGGERDTRRPSGGERDTRRPSADQAGLIRGSTRSAKSSR